MRGRGFRFYRREFYQRERHFYDVVLRWVAENYPEFSPLFQIQSLPRVLPLESSIVLHIPWFQDPVQEWSRWRYREANRLAARCDARGIPIINRVDRLINASRSVGARLMQDAGIRTPRTARIEDIAAFRETLLGLRLPLFVRDDWGHGKRMVRADTIEEARSLPLDEIARPVASEIVDVQDRRDGLFRKYRYIAVGELGVTHHLIITKGWVTRGTVRVKNDQTRDEELAYIEQQDPHHEEFQRARKALGLDFVAFDYGYDQEGRMVAWEANPYPFIQISTDYLSYRNHAIHRTLAAMLRLYLHTGGIPVPEKLEREARY